MNRVDQQLEKMEQEIKALRASFEINANSMKVYTKELQFTTQKNKTSWSNSQAYNPLQWEQLVSMAKESDGNRFSTETIVVTFDCAAGINTFAQLEINLVSGLDTNWLVIGCRRVPYSNGARWIVTTRPNLDNPSYDVWYPTVLKFAVQSAAEGTLTAKMIWQ